MVPSDLRAADIAFFARKITEYSEFDDLSVPEMLECEGALKAALATASAYTGINVLETDFEDITYAVKVMAAEMLDNHQISAQYTGKNPLVYQILDLHSTNLLPSVEE